MKKIFSIFAAATVALMTSFSCTKVDTYEDPNNPLPVVEATGETLQGLEISPKANYVVVGESVTLSVTLVPENASVDQVTWTSSDPSVATVDGEGNVTTLSTGVAMVTAAAGDQSVTAIVNVFAERVPATEIKLNKSEINLLVGRATKVKATLLPDGTGEDGAATTDKQNFVWTSSNENVAVVSYGFIQAVGLGEATVTVSQDGLSASCKVTVADKITLVDRSSVWPITDTPKWDKDWSGRISGSHEEVTVSDFDGEYAFFEVVSADKFTSIEAVANAVYEQVEERKDNGQDPKSLFTTGEVQTKNYSEVGEAVAYVLGYDSEFEFTGEYSLYEFTARTPDPVHATGISFSTGDALTVKEGKNTMVQASVLPEDCTDVSKYVWTSTDESVATVAYAYTWSDSYSYYVRITGVSVGETDITCTYADVSATLHVTVTGSDITWTDRSADWAGSFQMGKLYDYYDVFGFNLESCTSSSHFISVVQASDISGDPYEYYKTVAGQNADYLNWYSSSDIPDFSGSYGDTDESIERYAYVFGVANGDFDGNYAIFHYDPSNPGGGDEPDPEPKPVDGKMVSMSSNYFSVTWEDDVKTLDEVTMEGWVYGDSFTSGGNDGLHSMMGVEGVFLIRFDGAKPEVVYGGTQKSNGEYNEKKVTTSTSFSDKEWHHVAATYKKGDKVVLYIDGEEAGSNDAEDHGVDMNGVGAGWAGGGLADWHFYIGVSCQTSRDFDGSLAYLRVWDTARSASEIKDNMKKADPDDNGWNLLANWYFNEGAGNTVTDQSYNGYDITANSNLSWIDGTLPF